MSIKRRITILGTLVAVFGAVLCAFAGTESFVPSVRLLLALTGGFIVAIGAVVGGLGKHAQALAERVDPSSSLDDARPPGARRPIDMGTA
jgi:hypothetical protein